MFRCPRITQYALEAVLDVAWHGRSGPVQSKDITERQGIPRRYLEQVMQELVHAGVLVGVRGPRGGYRLARDPATITLGEVARVIDALSLVEERNPPASGSALGQQVIGPLLTETRQALVDRLNALTIEDLCQRAQGAGL